MSRWRAAGADLLLHSSLSIPCIYHGIWNLSKAGDTWWHAASGLPPALRFLVGAGEVAAAVGIWSGAGRRLAATGLAVIFLGAIPQHMAAGFSFKHGGYETPLAYLLLSIFIALRRRRDSDIEPPSHMDPST